MSFTQSAMCRMRAAIRCLRRCNALPAVCQLQDAYYIELGPPAEQHLDLMLRRPRSGRLEAWAASPSFETRSFGPLLRMRSEEHCFTALATVKRHCRTSVNRVMNHAMRTAHAGGTDMILGSMRQFGWLIATALCAVALPSLAQDMQENDKPAARAAVHHRG